MGPLAGSSQGNPKGGGVEGPGGQTGLHMPSKKRGGVGLLQLASLESDKDIGDGDRVLVF